MSSARAPGKSTRSGSAPSTSCACQLRPSSDSTTSERPRCSTTPSLQRITSPSSGASTALPLHSNASARGSCRPSTSGSPTPAAEAAPDQPLQLDRARRAGRRGSLRSAHGPRRRLALARSSSCDAHEAPVTRRDRRAQLVDEPLARVLATATPDRNDATSRSGSRRLASMNTTGCEGSRALEPPCLLAHIARPCAGARAGRVGTVRHGLSHLPPVARRAPSASSRAGSGGRPRSDSSAPTRSISRDMLLRLAAPRICARLDPKRSPAVLRGRFRTRSSRR